VSGWATPGRSSLLAATLARVEDFLLAPAEARDRGASSRATSGQPPVVTVVPLAPRCGGTTVARGLAATFAERHAPGAAIVCGPSSSVALALQTGDATRLARAVDGYLDVPHRVTGRLCLVEVDARMARAAAVRTESALVIEVPHGCDASEAAALADVTVLVAAPRTEPSLVAVVGASLARTGPEPIVVAGRPGEEPGMAAEAAVALPDARLASRIALAGREPPGPLGTALSDLADRCEAAS
jgi:hypothetical protein